MKPTAVPVILNREYQVRPLGRATKDFYAKIENFIIFIKGVPDNYDGEKELLIKITTIKDSYAFAVFIDLL